MRADINFAQTEGYLRAVRGRVMPSPAPSTRSVKAKEEAKEMVILINRGAVVVSLISLSSYDACLSGKLNDYTMPDEDIE